MEFPTVRPRRLRRTPSLRAMVAETSFEARQLVLPMFVREGASEPIPISSMPGVVQHTRDSLKAAAAEAAELGLGGVMLFGVPEKKDATGSGALDPNGILNVAINDVVGEVGDAVTVMSDLCLDEFTSHGHCGVLDNQGRVDNDATLAVYAEMGLAHAAAGVDLVGPSGMMDGQVGVIRSARPDTPTSESWPTPRNMPPPSTDPSARPWTPRCRAIGAPISRTPGTPSKASAKPSSTSRRVPTW